VDARRITRARSELEDSRTKLPPGAELRLATWQRLYRLLSVPEFAGVRWATDLKAYLSFSGLDSFQGIRGCVASAEVSSAIRTWWARTDSFGFRATAKAALSQPIGSLHQWRAQPAGAHHHLPLRTYEQWVTSEAAGVLNAWSHRWNQADVDPQRR
jgi:hypothetical protein